MAEDDVDSDDVVVERAAEGQRRRRVSARQAPIDDIEYKLQAIDVLQQYLEERINCGMTCTYMTYYDYDQIHVKLFSGDTCVKATEWHRDCEKKVSLRDK